MSGQSSLIVDVDGTLVPIKKEDEEYNVLPPDEVVRERLVQYRSMGFNIVLFSARGMRTYGSDLRTINRNVRQPLESWLRDFEVPCDQLILGKPWPGPAGFYVDDRSIRPQEFKMLDYQAISDVIAGARVASEGPPDP